MLYLSDNNQTDIIEAFNSTSRYLGDLLNIDNPYFEQMVGQIYPTERDEFNFKIVNFPILDGAVPRSPSFGVYISQLIRFVRVCSNVDDFNNRNLFLTAKL